MCRWTKFLSAKDEHDNVETCCVRQFRGAKSQGWSHAPKEFITKSVRLWGLPMDFDCGRPGLPDRAFTILKGPLARLERALGQFMLDLHTEQHGYTEVMPTSDGARRVHVWHRQSAEICRRPVQDQSDGRWLIPTAEVPLTNLVREEILSIRTVCHCASQR